MKWYGHQIDNKKALCECPWPCKPDCWKNWFYAEWWCLFSSQETNASGGWVLPDKIDFFPLYSSPQILIPKTQKEIESRWEFCFLRGSYANRLQTLLNKWFWGTKVLTKSHAICFWVLLKGSTTEAVLFLKIFWEQKRKCCHLAFTHS